MDSNKEFHFIICYLKIQIILISWEWVVDLIIDTEKYAATKRINPSLILNRGVYLKRKQFLHEKK